MLDSSKTIVHHFLVIGLLSCFGACSNTACPSEKADRMVRSFTSDPGHGSHDVFAACLEAGGNPNSTASTGSEPDDWTPLLLTAFGNFNDGSRQSNDSLWNAASLEQAQLLLDHGADLNAVTPEGANALHLAASAGRIELCKFLLSKGIAVDVKSKAGTTPLFGAVVAGSTELVGLLLAKGADVNAVSAEGQTPLDIAAILVNDREQAYFRGAKGFDPQGVYDLLKRKGARHGTAVSP